MQNDSKKYFRQFPILFLIILFFINLTACQDKKQIKIPQEPDYYEIQSVTIDEKIPFFFLIFIFIVILMFCQFWKKEMKSFKKKTMILLAVPVKMEQGLALMNIFPFRFLQMEQNQKLPGILYNLFSARKHKRHIFLMETVIVHLG